MKMSLALIFCSPNHSNSTKQRLLLLAFALLATLGFSQNADSLVAVQQVVDSLIQVSRTLTGQGDFDKALEVNAVAEKLALGKLGRESAAYGSCCHNRASVANFKRNLPEAEKWYTEALSVRGKVLGKGHPDYSASLSNLGILYKDLGDYEKAEQLQVEAKAIMEKAIGKNHPDYAPCLFNLANLYEIMGDYEKAEPLYLETKSLVEKALGKDHPGYIRCLNNLGNLYMDLGNNEKAEQLYLESNAIREKKLGKKHPLYATSLFNLATLYMAMGKYEKAEPLYLESKTIREITMSKNHPDYVSLLNNLAILYMDMGKYEKAEPLYLEAIASGEKAFGRDHPEYARLIGNLAFLHWRKGEFQKAEPLYLEAMSIQEKTLGKEHPGYLSNLVNLFVLYEAQGRHAESESLMRFFFGLTQSQFLESTAFLSERELANYGASFRFNGNHLLGFLLSRFEKGDKFGLLPNLSYDQVIFQKGFLLTAASRLNLLTSSSSESQELNRALQVCRRRLAAEYTKPIAERDSANVATLEEKANTLEKGLARTVADYGDPIRQVKWQEVQAKLKPGEAAVEFIHYHYYLPKITDSTMYVALVLRPGDTQPHFIPLFEEKNLKAVVGESAVRRMDYVANLYQSSSARGITPDSTKSLYELIWSPLQSALNSPSVGGGRGEAVKTIYYSPSGILHRLNMGAIAINQDSLLSDRYQLVRLGSTRQLVTASTFAEASADKTAIIYGGVRYDMDSTAIGAANAAWNHDDMATNRGELSFTYADSTLRGGTWEYLKWTEKEAAAVASILTDAGIPVEVRKGYEATEESFKQIGKDKPSPRILHLATHGFFFPDPKDNPQSAIRNLQSEAPIFKISDHPMIRSGLILAGANHAWKTGKPLRPDMDDGILTAYEISQMNLSNTELVVLSACETGLGDIAGNEGVYGLQRAFKIAGVRYLIMSLWQVPDFQTQELMSAFYRKWLKERLPVRQALEAAQREMRDKGFEPYYWAGFVLVE